MTKLESAYLDLQPDTALDLNKKRRLLRWDAKKRKFVKVCSRTIFEVRVLSTYLGLPFFDIDDYTVDLLMWL